MQAPSPILVVDDDAVSRHVLTEALLSAGMDVAEATSGTEAIAFLEQHRPALVLLDLIMPDPDGYAVLRHIRARPNLADVPVVVLTALDSDEEIGRVFASGADDYVHKPFRPAELVARIRGQLRIRDYVERLSRREQDSQTVLELTQALASTLNIRGILFTVVQRVAEVARVDRCSIVLVRQNSSVGHVVATSDDAELTNLAIALEKYPEIQQVLSTGQTLVIRDAHRHPLLKVVRESDGGLEFKSLALVPISHDHRPTGVIFLRARDRVAFPEHEIALVQTVANATAIALRNARILQSLRDATQESSHLREEAEQRARLFQRYADVFESATDGMIVLDPRGRVIFANLRAKTITGYSDEELLASSFASLLGGNDALAKRLQHEFLDRAPGETVDLVFPRKDGTQLTLSMNLSPVLHEDTATLWTFRDVTQERRTDIELRQTKEFLERVIESSVDGIVSADLSGKLLLFNRAAGRIFGYSKEAVVGKMSVEALYPPGVAREVMRRIRDPNENGPGRLEGYRVDMLSATGTHIPVTLSASVIFENGRPVGSVGIFTDIRERLRMEQRLTRAQEELRSREKQAIVAELAGAAAHELNQPLTSVIGYAELLRRNLDADTPMFNAAGVIISEAERMAEIVRKVGKITKYETKSYVGGAKILDLEKASADSDPEARR
ncbi:MAG: PAS domain S-box protein [Polyangiaceae bacterium]